MPTPADFEFDVFLSYGTKDKARVLPIAERLRTDGLRVWFSEWEIAPGDDVLESIENGLNNSRVLVLCTSRQALASDWQELEATTFRFRDPLNNERRFIPLRLDEAPVRGWLARYLYLSWSSKEREQSYAKLLYACRSQVEPARRISARPERSPPLTREPIPYVNAKVLLVGESGAGKTGLSKVLAGEAWQPSDSTVGAWATQWKLPLAAKDNIEREIWLWDFGGQADQRLIQQLYIEDATLVVLVFDGQREDMFETLYQWDRELSRVLKNPVCKLLVAGRVDAGSPRVSKSHIETFVKDRGFSAYIETSARVGTGCEELKQAIVDGIRWHDVPWRSSSTLFKRLKAEIIRLKQEDRILIRFNELRDLLQLRLSGETERVADEELKRLTENELSDFNQL
jgi:small GTP-binding protein